jgi:hypothetical protein
MMALSAAIAVGLAIVSVAVASRGANHAPGMTAPAAHTQPVALPDSHGGWDPYVAVAPDGTLYVSFMITSEHREYPIIEVSRDQGQTFTVESSLAAAAERQLGRCRVPRRRTRRDVVRRMGLRTDEVARTRTVRGRRELLGRERRSERGRTELDRRSELVQRDDGRHARVSRRRRR